MRRLTPVFVVFAVLLALVVWKETSRSGPGMAPGAGDVVPLAATPFAAKDVARIEVFAPGSAQPSFTLAKEALAKEGDRWLVLSPFRAPAHGGNAESLAKTLAEAEAELRSDDAGTLASFDLTPERAVGVRLAAADGRTLAHVAVGRTSHTQGAFVRHLGDAGGTRAYVTTADLRGLLGLARTVEGAAEPEAPKPDRFHDTTFPATDFTRARRVALTTPGRRVVFERQGAKWEAVEGGPGAPVAAEAVPQVLEAFGDGFRARGLVDPSDLGRLGLTSPGYTLEVTLDDGAVRRVVGSLDPAADAGRVRIDVVQDPDVVYEAESWEFRRLFPPGASLFEMSAPVIDDAALGRVVVERGGDRIEIARNGSKPGDEWRVVAPAWPLAPRQASLRNLASALRAVRATDWLDAGDAGAPPASAVAPHASAAAPHTNVHFGPAGADDGSLSTFRFGGKTAEGERTAVFPGAPGRVFVVADGTVERLAVPPLTLFESKLFHGWTESDVTAVRVARRDVGGAWAPELVMERSAGGWTVARADGADGAKVAANADAAARAVTALLAAEVRDVGGEGEPVVRITVERANGAAVELELAEVKDGRRAASVGGFRFVCDTPDLVPSADALLAAPSGAAPPPDEEE